MADEEHDYEDDISEDIDEDIDIDEDEDEVEEEEEVDEFVEHQVNNDLTVVIIPPNERVTSDLLNKFEVAAVVGARATQIADGDECFVETNENDTAINIAKRELDENRCPMCIEREIHRNKNMVYVERIPVRELIYVHDN